MKELGITKGEHRVVLWENTALVQTDDHLIASFDKGDGYATLLSDAANTAQSCGLLPSELLKQRDELLTVLKELVHLHSCEQEGILSGQPTPEQWYAAVDAAESAIKSTEG